MAGGRMSGRMSSFRFAWLGLFCLIIAGGCGKGKGDLSGKVSFGDKTVVTGTVTIVASDGSTFSAVIQEDGAYSFQGVPAGPAKLAVTSPNPVEIKHAKRKKDEEAKPKVESKGWFPIPDKYTDPEQSEITFTLKRGKNTFDIALK